MLGVQIHHAVDDEEDLEYDERETDVVNHWLEHEHHWADPLEEDKQVGNDPDYLIVCAFQPNEQRDRNPHGYMEKVVEVHL